MFLVGKLNLLVYRDAAQTEFPDKKVVDISEDYSDESVAESQETTFSLAASGTQAITFNSVATVRKVYIFSDTTDITVSFNGGASITYKAGFPGIMPLELTSLSITNASSSASTGVTVILITG